MAVTIPSTATTPFAAFPKPKPRHSFLLPVRASSDPSPDPTPVQTASSDQDSDDDFESRLSRIRGRNRVGSGKKARKSSSSSPESAGIYLPPVPLKVPRSEGMKVEFGFSPYSERVNGRMAMLGLAALLLVEVAAGKGVINYHTPGVILTQIYFVVGVSALFVKYEKERVSVWPNDRSSKE